MVPNKTIAFHTLGCKLNFAETSTLSRILEKEGFERKEFQDDADIYVINTCSVTENAAKECRQIVRRLRRTAPEDLIVVTGCYAQLKPEEIAGIPGVDLVLGAAEKFNIAEHLKHLTKGESAKICSCDIETIQGFEPAFSLHDRTRAFLKLQDGCDYNCSFCTIPMARGKSRSDSIANACRNTRQLASGGIKEIVLTGVNLGDFGTSPVISQSSAEKSNRVQPREDLFQLICELDKIEGIQRYRISSIEPNLLTNSIIEFVAQSNKFMPHFHIPLQSGSNRILGLMRRRYKTKLYEERIKAIKDMMPHCAIGADVIVGFPGETEADFQETVDFLHKLEISYLHVFTYSERENTAALGIKPSVPLTIRQTRNKTLRNLSFMKMQYFSHLHAGQTRKVLFERQSKNSVMEGYTDNYIKITTPYKKDWVNEIVDWRL